jgi:protein pelota
VRVLKRDPRTGEVKLRLQSLDDLWHVSNLVVRGDLVRASTTRRREDPGDKARPERMDKVRMTLGVRVDDVEFREFDLHLRISGVIEEGPQDLGRHHTFTVAPDDEVEIQKVWRASELARIDEAVGATEKPLGTFLAIDDEEAVIAQLRQYGVREAASIQAPRQGKMFPGRDEREAHYEEVLAALKRADLGQALVILGPGFERDRFGRWLAGKDAALAARAVQHGTSQGGMRGVAEALRSGAGAKVFEESRVGMETRLVERLLGEMGRDGACAYGPAAVAAAVAGGAVETLLVSEEKLRDTAVEAVLRRVEQARGRAVVVSAHHEAGKKLQALGGIAALLRYRPS